MNKAMWLALALALTALLAPASEAAMSCNTVQNALYPCVSYVLYGGAVVPPACCQGIKGLYKQASATADRQAVCSCLKSVAQSAPQAAIANAAALPGKCGVTIPYKISPSTNCANVR
ncbi:Non-specific lipid-transfer protein 10 [Striga hermonthica]|uniref:Non-specific lipid-transfer protein n=1 Tax=Striga hermonthica TaxID=68872 RepID=A0A9N7NIL5_STRHE|nr:Non-specific lipid-transfer protein 10 [Striga hermonthica]